MQYKIIYGVNMRINIDNVKMETIEYIDERLYRHHKDGLRDLKKLVSVTFNTNSILLDVLKALLKYDEYVKIKYFKNNNTDSLFIKLTGTNHSLIKIFNKYNKILDGVTYKEQSMIKYIQDNSYISKKYNYYDNIPNSEYGIYETTTTDTYNDYYNYNNQKIFKNKRIQYNNIKQIKQDIVTKTLNNACTLITDFKLSDTPIKLNSKTLTDIFNYRVKVCSFKLHNNYHRVKSNYNSYEEFIKYMVYYGASHYNNQRFWSTVKRELY